MGPQHWLWAEVSVAWSGRAMRRGWEQAGGCSSGAGRPDEAPTLPSCGCCSPRPGSPRRGQRAPGQQHKALYSECHPQVNAVLKFWMIRNQGRCFILQRPANHVATLTACGPPQAPAKSLSSSSVVLPIRRPPGTGAPQPLGWSVSEATSPLGSHHGARVRRCPDLPLPSFSSQGDSEEEGPYTLEQTGEPRDPLRLGTGRVLSSRGSPG